MPVLTSSSSHLGSSTFSRQIPSFASRSSNFTSHLSSSLPRGSRSSYEISPRSSQRDLTLYPSRTGASSALSTSSSSSSYNYKASSSNSYHTSSSSGYPGSSTVTLTRYKTRNDYNENDSPLKYASTSSYSSSLSSPSPSIWRKKFSSSSSPSSSLRSSSSLSSSTSSSNDDNNNKNPTKLCLSGLTNLGNTCYMNSVIQALYATERIRKIVTNNQRSPLISSLGRLFEDMNNSSHASYSNPSTFRSQFVKFQPKFRSYDQQDAQEFLRYLLNGLHDEMNRAAKVSRRPFDAPKNANEAWSQYKAIDDSPLIDVVAGQLSSEITCGICGNVSTCWDPFWDLSLPLPQRLGTCNVERCLKEFTALEVLDHDERPVCEKCRKPVSATKKLAIEKPPPILILHLKRFTNEGYKLTTPQLLIDHKLNVKSKVYTLYACVCHHGNSSRSGHYTAYCNYDSKWFHFNDQRVTEIKDMNLTDHLSDSYILFYQESSNQTGFTTYSSRL